MDWDNCL